MSTVIYNIISFMFPFSFKFSSLKTILLNKKNNNIRILQTTQYNLHFTYYINMYENLLIFLKMINYPLNPHKVKKWLFTMIIPWHHYLNCLWFCQSFLIFTLQLWIFIRKKCEKMCVCWREGQTRKNLNFWNILWTLYKL